jgi:hypothetical protein
LLLLTDISPNCFASRRAKIDANNEPKYCGHGCETVPGKQCFVIQMESPMRAGQAAVLVNSRAERVQSMAKNLLTTPKFRAAAFHFAAGQLRL